MKRTLLVTGATGFLGTHLVARLLESGAALRVLTRSRAEELRARGIEFVEGSVLDENACAAAVRGASAIFHLAGQVSRNPDDSALLYEVHVRGTAVLCKAAKKAGVERLVLASTSGTIAVTEDGETIPDETFPPPLKLIGKWPYYTSKLFQEETARRECQGGPDLVILNPSLLLGPGDRKLSSTEDVLKLLASEIPVIPPGGVSFVDVRDAALAFESAAKGITVNTLAPGYVATEMVRAVPKEVLDTKIIPQIPVGRLGEADEIARAVVFLAADEAGFVTGACLDINGGHYMAT